MKFTSEVSRPLTIGYIHLEKLKYVLTDQKEETSSLWKKGIQWGFYFQFNDQNHFHYLFYLPFKKVKRTLKFIYSQRTTKMWYLFKFLWPSQNTYRNFRRNSYKWKLLSRWNSIVLHSPKTVWRCENYYATQYCEVFQFRQPNFSRRRSNLKRNFEVVFLQNHVVVVVVVLYNWIKFYMKSHLDLNSLLISRNGF